MNETSCIHLVVSDGTDRIRIFDISSGFLQFLTFFKKKLSYQVLRARLLVLFQYAHEKKTTTSVCLHSYVAYYQKKAVDVCGHVMCSAKNRNQQYALVSLLITKPTHFLRGFKLLTL